MRVFVTGATGVLGHRLVGRLADAGHEVVGLVRDTDGARAVASQGGEPHRGDVLAKESLAAGVAGADAVVHAATDVPVDTPTTARDWRANDRVRLAGTRNLVALAATAGIDRLVLPSVVWAVRDPAGHAVDERSPPNPDRTTASAVEAERLLRESCPAHTDWTVLRFGWFYGPRSAQTRRLARQLLAGDLVTVGRGVTGRRDCTVSAIHTADAAAATVAALERGADGTFHVVDDQPVTTAEFFCRLATRLDVPAPSRVPGWLARRFVGADLVRFLTRPFPSTNARFRRATDWEPAYPTVAVGLEHVVQRWLDAGLLVPTGDGYRWRDRYPSRYQCRTCGRVGPSFYDACRHCDSPNVVSLPVRARDKSLCRPT